jgi:hypothetical protein
MAQDDDYTQRAIDYAYSPGSRVGTDPLGRPPPVAPGITQAGAPNNLNTNPAPTRITSQIGSTAIPITRLDMSNLILRQAAAPSSPASPPIPNYNYAGSLPAQPIGNPTTNGQAFNTPLANAQRYVQSPSAGSIFRKGFDPDNPLGTPTPTPKPTPSPTTVLSGGALDRGAYAQTQALVAPTRPGIIGNATTYARNDMIGGPA